MRQGALASGSRRLWPSRPGAISRGPASLRCVLPGVGVRREVRRRAIRIGCGLEVSTDTIEGFMPRPEQAALPVACGAELASPV